MSIFQKAKKSTIEASLFKNGRLREAFKILRVVGLEHS